MKAESPSFLIVAIIKRQDIKTKHHIDYINDYLEIKLTLLVVY